MLHENEVLMFLLGLGVLVFILTNRLKFKSIPASKILFIGYLLLLVGWFSTVFEGYFFENVLNYLEHTCYAISAIFIAVWCWKVFGSKEETG
ncbi:MAG: hypothetical protein ACE5JK_03280 [Candidatus Omnitrophota bacterium]